MKKMLELIIEGEYNGESSRYVDCEELSELIAKAQRSLKFKYSEKNYYKLKKYHDNITEGLYNMISKQKDTNIILLAMG